MAKLYRKDTIVTPSKSSKEQILRLGFRRNKVNTVYDGVGSEFLKAKVGNKKGNTIVCLGKLRRYKRFDHALLAFKSILNGPDNDYKLIIAGKVSEIDRSYLEWLVNFARRLNIQNNVEFKVNISDDEKLKLLEESRLLVQPSPVEGFSIVVAEANRCGTPVVVSDGVPSDVVVDKLNGLVYPYGDIQDFSAKMSKLLEDPLLWRSMSKNAYEWSQQFTWQNSVLEFQKLLQSICSPPLAASTNELKGGTFGC